MSEQGLYGVTAEFAAPEDLVEALRRLRYDGFERIETYTPIPVEDADRALGRRNSLLPLVVALACALGGGLGLFLQYYGSAIGYPVNVGGRPLASWPAFGPSTFEIAVLSAIIVGFLAFLAVNRLTMLYHPIFDAPGFEETSCDRFLLCVEAVDPHFDRERVHALLASSAAYRIADIPA